MIKKLPLSFYLRPDVAEIARDLLGKIIVTKFGGINTIGRITETEAYNGIHDKASHAYGGRRTNRTEIMYARGGVAYVYLCYGIHYLFNVVTNVADIPHAVLIRAIDPVKGKDEMLTRLNKIRKEGIIKGPGNASRALGITLAHTGDSLTRKDFYIADDGYIINPSKIIAGPRIGVAYALEDALLPYRFIYDNK
ncbi:MAG TPA: DNA-3-methyladenine glycosylase [Flavitalea sp.]|nr:DNA-3-methyladenine glycosylase [Flavitalea sp.]